MANVIDGVHLVVDGTTSDPKLFTQENLINLISELAKEMDMTVIMGPLFKEVPVDPSKLTGDVFQDEGGISGFAMISTSHISIHVWPLRKVFMMDVFSCKYFNHVAALDIIKSKLSAVDINGQCIVRKLG